jgi:hypothetical protein
MLTLLGSTACIATTVEAESRIPLLHVEDKKAAQIGASRAAINRRPT